MQAAAPPSLNDEIAARDESSSERGDGQVAEVNCGHYWQAASQGHCDLRVPARAPHCISSGQIRRRGPRCSMRPSLAEEARMQVAHWANLGAARRGAKRYDEALRAYGVALRGNLGAAANANLLYEVGLTHIDRLSSSPRAPYWAAPCHDPYNAEIRYRYANTCYQSQQKDEGLRALAGWQQLDGLTSELLANIGALLMNLGDSTGAELALQQAAADRVHRRRPFCRWYRPLNAPIACRRRAALP